MTALNTGVLQMIFRRNTFEKWDYSGAKQKHNGEKIECEQVTGVREKFVVLFGLSNNKEGKATATGVGHPEMACHGTSGTG